MPQTHATTVIKPIVGQAFILEDHQMALKWAERQRPVPVRTVMEIDHEAFPEAIGVMFYSPHGDDEALYRVWRNLAGDTVIDDGFSSEQSIFPTLSEALASITVKEADKLGRWLQSKLR